MILNQSADLIDKQQARIAKLEMQLMQRCPACPKNEFADEFMAARTLSRMRSDATTSTTQSSQSIQSL